jgi:glycerol-3-phosphate O-acyltransferase/dihydroxyacetone phosphate acyltransferase
MNYAALKFGEAGVDVLKYVCHLIIYSSNDLMTVRSLRPLIVALVPGQQRSLDKLKAMRVQLSNEVADLINDFGPTLYEDFNEVRSWLITKLIC